MALKFIISPSKCSFVGLDPEEEAALGLLKIMVGDNLLTDEVDFIGNEALNRPGPYVSGYHLAEWLVWNWWRLRWEPRLVGQSSENFDWNLAHRMSTIGEGYVWPSITIFSDGFWTSLLSESSSEADASLFRYSGAKFASVPASDLEAAIDEFVPQMIHSTNNANLCGTNLHLLWQDLLHERQDQESSRYRKFEALLGRDPDELDSQQVELALGDSTVLGEKALEEIAVGSVSGVDGTSGMLSAAQIIEITEHAGFVIKPEDAVKVDVPELHQWGNRAAWRIGVSAANAIRTQERLGDEPITDVLLAELVGATDEVLHVEKQSDAFSWVLRGEGGLAQVALRPKRKTGRRFELARLLGDCIFAEPIAGATEPLSPATRSYSYRQKAQRAFAAELLSPWPVVKEMLGDDYSEENQEQVADHFLVSQRTISTLLRNNANVGDEDRMLLRY